jgi:Domain of unknown function (DUF4412)
MSLDPRRTSILGVLALAALPAAAQDLTIVSKETHGDGQPQIRTTYIGSSHMRISEADGQGFLADLANGTITMIDGKKKQYWTMTHEELEAAQAQMAAQMKQMQAQMENMPPAVREKMKGMMGGMMGGIADTINVARATGGRTIAGYACDNWVVTVAELSREEVCVTTQLKLPVQAYEAQKRFASTMGGGPNNPMAKQMSALADKYKEMKGFPLASQSTTTLLGKTRTTTTEVTEINKGAIADSVWQVPAGYKKVESPLAKLGRARPR